MNTTQNTVIEIIARGLWIHEGKVLLCQNIKHGHQFFPGGHVDFGEKSSDALRRELIEELGVEVTVGRFLGVCEAKFDQDKKGEAVTHHEMTLLFEIVAADAQTDPFRLESQESHIRFVWRSVQDVMDWQAGGIMPPAIRGLVRSAVRVGCPEMVTDWE
jgi:ADP-ribose pyrophosphatase YjhB (NUDIX family)